jgi:DNA repair ATPase RecN
MNENNPDNLSPSTEEQPSSETVETTLPVQPPSRIRQFFARLLRWTFGLLIIFGLGFLAAVFTLYIPGQQALKAKETGLKEANQKIATLTSQVSDLSSLDKKNQETTAELQKANLHLLILRARIDVANAQLAMVKNEPEKARLSLNGTPDTLKSLEKLVESGQVKIVTDMQARLTLTLSEIDSTPYAASSDLDVLATSLMELENAYFTSP